MIGGMTGFEFNKDEYVEAVAIILDMTQADRKELKKMNVETLERLYAGQKANALAYQELQRGNKV